MTFLPVVERELRVAGRRPQTHWLRFLAALLVVGVGLVLLIGNQNSMSPPQVGRLLFHAVSILAFGFALLAGLFLTADCLCSERREGTLGLLFLTDLKGYDVVLGKLAATSMVAVYALLAVVPMLGLPLLMGGASVGEFGRMVLVLLATLLLSLAAGMFASAVCRDTRGAMMACFFQMIFLTGVLFLAAGVLDAMIPGRWVKTIVMLPSPLFAFLNWSDSGFATRAGLTPFWICIGAIGALALAQLALAAFLLPRTWQEGDGQARPVQFRRPRSRGSVTRLALNPYYWLLTRERFPGMTGRLCLGLLFAVWWSFWIGAAWSSKGRGADELMVTCLFMSFGLHWVGKLLIVVQASRRLSEDRRDGALELLLVTPLSPRSIVEAHGLALTRQFRRLLGLLWAMNGGLVLLFTVLNHVGMPGEIQWTFAMFAIGGAVLLLVDFHALTWVGMAEALAGRRQQRAVLRALGRIMAPPIIAIFLFVFLSMNSGASASAVNVFHFVWFVISLVTSLTAIGSRKGLLLDHFRSIASGDHPRPKNDLFRPAVGWDATGAAPSQTPP